MRFHGNLGGPDVSIGTIPDWSTGSTISGPDEANAHGDVGSETKAVCCRGIAAAKATKRSETDIRESQRLDSTAEPGERDS
jgi:hypothetical protein